MGRRRSLKELLLEDVRRLLREDRGSLRNDALRLLVCGMVAGVGLLIGGSLLLGLAAEPEKSETFLVAVGAGAVLGGVGCGLYCCHILTHRAFDWLYPVALVITFVGYAVAIIGQAIYASR